jgi:hypothetical protein
VQFSVQAASPDTFGYTLVQCEQSTDITIITTIFYRVSLQNTIWRLYSIEIGEFKSPALNIRNSEGHIMLRKVEDIFGFERKGLDMSYSGQDDCFNAL